jgi:chromosome segregation ATPase
MFLDNILCNQMSGNSSVIPRFEVLRSLFIELITRNQHLNEKVNQLEKQHHTHINELKVTSNHLNVFIDQHNDQLKKDQIPMKKLKTENEQLQKQFGEYITRFDEVQIENKHGQEQTNQLRQQCQQENQTHMRELENMNNRLNTLFVPLNDLLQDNKIQIKKNVDENQQLKEEGNNLRKQHQIEMKELLHIIDRVNLYDNEHTDRLKMEQNQMKELKSEHEQFKKQVDEQMIRCNELQNGNRSFKEQIEQQCQKENQTHIKASEDTNDRLNADIRQLRDQLDNTVIQIKRVEDENRQLKEVHQLDQELRQQQHIRIKELVDITDDFRKCIKEHDGRLTQDQVLMKELKTENEQFKKRVDELQNDNRSFKEQIKQLGQSCQQANQTHIKASEDTNDRLNADIGQLRDQPDNTAIQIKRVEDENGQLKEQLNRLKKQTEQQQSVSTEVKDINNHPNSFLTQLDTRFQRFLIEKIFLSFIKGFL